MAEGQDGKAEKKEKKEKKEKVREGDAAAKDAEESLPEGLLAKLRPRRRPLFFFVFVCFCLWIMVFYNPCEVDNKLKKDCGFSGVSSLYCMTGSCFTNRGGKMEKKIVKVKRKEGQLLGLDVSKDEGKDPWVLVSSIDSGAVQEYNSKLPGGSEERIKVGDAIAKVDGVDGKDMVGALKRKGAKDVELQIRRTHLPSYLSWIRSSARPGPVESVLTAPGFKRWSAVTSQLSGVGLGLWLLSGYPVASLPGYYFSLSAAVAFKVTRCCHDEKVPAGVAHCYRGVTDEPQIILEKAWESSRQFTTKTLKSWRIMARKNAPASLKGFFGAK